MEYEASITQDDENPHLLRLTIRGIQKIISKPSFSEVVDYSKVETMEEVRKYETVEDLRADIGREKTWRSIENVGSWILMSAIFPIMWVSKDYTYILGIAFGSIPMLSGMVLRDHALDGIRKYKSAMEEFRLTRFRAEGRLNEDDQQIPATDLINH